MVKRTVRASRRSRRDGVRRRLLIESLGDRRVLAAIAGSVFEDVDLSFRQESEEIGLAGRIVYIDANNNDALDAGELLTRSDSEGRFTLSGVEDGTYWFRLFDGTDSQVATIPVAASVGPAVAIEGGAQVVADGSAFVLAGDGVWVGDLRAGTATAISVAAEVTKMQTLPDGTLLVIGRDPNGNSVWVVDPADQSVEPISVSTAGVGAQWSDVAIDGYGRGVLVQRGDGVSVVYSVDASAMTMAGSGLQVSMTSTLVPEDTQVLSSASGNRTVFAWSGSEGMQVSLWSNVTATPISPLPVELDQASEMLAFDDASGLLVLRTLDGDVAVHDVNQNFARLHTLSNLDGPIAVDGDLERLVTLSPVDSMLRWIDLRDGTRIADLAVDLSAIGSAVELSLGDRSDAIAVLGMAGVAEISLSRSASRRVQVAGGQDVDGVLFGVTLVGSNTPPVFQSLPTLVTSPGVTLETPPLSALQSDDGSPLVVDAEGDGFVLIQVAPAAFGSAQVSSDGSITYTPPAGFLGTDSIPVILHDGRDSSDVVNLPIAVTPTGDVPRGAPISENVQPGVAVADIRDLLDLGPNDAVVLQDARFELIDNQIVFVGESLDFETEPFLTIPVLITDTATSEQSSETLVLSVQNENDPITDITPHHGEVTEGVLGDPVQLIIVIDEDPDQLHTFTVDDERFVFEGNSLQLADDVMVDFEQEQEIRVNVTASDGAGSTLTREIVIQVIDVVEQPQSIMLNGDTVMELVPGAIVGDISVDGMPPDDRFRLTVDDPRFEIADSTLKLIDDQFVERAAQEEIQLTITAADTFGDFQAVSETFVIEVLENQTPYHNDDNPYDVNHSGDVTSLDALLVINYLNVYGPGPVGQGDPVYCYDVNGDGMITALDALLILNEIARINGDDGTVGNRQAEGEVQDDPSTDPKTSGRELAAPQDEGEVTSDENVSDPVGGVYDEWGLTDSASPLPLPADDAGLTDPSHEFMSDGQTQSAEDYAEGVDQTLRLLSQRRV